VLVAPDRPAVDASDAGNLALGGVALQQCADRGSLVGFQDIHSLAFPIGEDQNLVSRQQVPAAPVFTPCPRSNQVGEFEVTTGRSLHFYVFL
jgi:hypothetical protein